MKKELDEIKDILCEIIQMDREEIEKYNINENSYLINELGVNSIPLSSYDYVSFITELERKYNIFYDFEKPVETIGDAICLIKKSEKWGL